MKKPRIPTPTYRNMWVLSTYYSVSPVTFLKVTFNSNGIYGSVWDMITYCWVHVAVGSCWKLFSRMNPTWTHITCFKRRHQSYKCIFCKCHMWIWIWNEYSLFAIRILKLFCILFAHKEAIKAWIYCAKPMK